jgi:hypothetical protein
MRHLFGSVVQREAKRDAESARDRIRKSETETTEGATQRKIIKSVL